jgi:hypothetical protein
LFWKRLIKFAHTVSSLGLIGGLAAYMLLLWVWPEVTSLEEYTALRASLAAVSGWLLLPSMIIVLVTGLLAMAVHYPYHEAPWVWIKALSGILVFEATLASVDGPAQAAATLSAQALAGEIDAATLATQVRDEWGAWWALLFLAVANVALATWRPRFNGAWKRRRNRKRERNAARARSWP